MATIDKYSNLTEKQRQAVLLNKGDALVSASAGSGKTHVIIERIIRLILEGQTTVDRLLAVTFTKLATSEMKEKLKLALLSEIVNGVDNLKWQYDEVNTCDISTIDSFCSKIVKKYFYKINIDYSFDILDEAKKKALKTKAIEEVLLSHYENPDQDFLDLAFILTSSKNDRLLKETISSFMTDSETRLDVNEIFSLSEQTHLNASKIIDKELTENVNEFGKFFEKIFLSYYNLFEEKDVTDFYIDKFVEISRILKDCKSVYDVVNCISVPKIPAKPRKKYDDFFPTFKNVHLKSFTDYVDYVINTCSLGKDGTDKYAIQTLSYVKELQKLTCECIEYYDNLKKEENCYDFCDIEKFAYTLLLDQEVLNAIKGEYDFIFIDEYQDVNDIQERIINLLAQNNEFMVGDSKQSIYGFRGCNPNYFISKYNAYNDQKNADKHAIGLDYNFRSASNVINSVNNVFNRVFTKNFGGFDYVESPMVFNDKYINYDGESTLHFYTENNTKKETPKQVYSVKEDFNSNTPTTYSNQVLLIASLVHKALNENYYDVKEKTYKPIKLSDICILFRKLNETNIKIIQELNALGVPVTAEAKIKLSTYPEIQAMIQLIKAIISLNDDIALSTTLSTIYGFTFDELACIRKNEDVNLTFYDAVISFSKKDGVLNKKVKDFLDSFEKIRLFSEYEKADEILYKVLDESGYESRILRSPFGEYKLKRVKRLINESNKNKKLTIKEFGAYLEDAFEDISTCETSGDDACKIMTIHASKGLEWPCVILAGTSSRFNFSDIERNRIIKHEKYGISIKYHDKDTMTIRETPLSLFIKQQSYLNASLEEARILYVAMTRAKYKLDVIAKQSNIFLGIPFFIKHPTCLSEFLTENDMAVVDHDNFVNVASSSSTLVAGAISEEETISAIINNFNYVYPYAELTKMPVKVSVSEVARQDEDEYFETTNLFGSTTKEEGTAYHKILQLIDFYADSVENEIEKLKKCNLITEEDLSLIKIDKIKSILNMDIFKTIKDYTLYKEEKFTFFISPKELGYSVSQNLQDKVLVQGIIDLMAIKDDKCILIDYKLSKVTSSDLIKKYKTQLVLYKNAIQNCLNIKVEKVYLVNILQEQLIEIK